LENGTTFVEPQLSKYFILGVLPVLLIILPSNIQADALPERYNELTTSAPKYINLTFVQGVESYWMQRLNNTDYLLTARPGEAMIPYEELIILNL